MTQRGQTGGTREVARERGIEVGRKAAGGKENGGMGGRRQDRRVTEGTGKRKRKER